MTRPCRRMIRHLLQIFFTLGLTFTILSSVPKSALAPHAVLAVGYLYR